MDHYGEFKHDLGAESQMLRQKLKEQPLLFTLLTGHSLMTLTTEVRNYQPHKKRAMTNIVQQPIHKQL